jgi:hypothetical protein
MARGLACLDAGAFPYVAAPGLGGSLLLQGSSGWMQQPRRASPTKVEALGCSWMRHRWPATDRRCSQRRQLGGQRARCEPARPRAARRRFKDRQQRVGSRKASPRRVPTRQLGRIRRGDVGGGDRSSSGEGLPYAGDRSWLRPGWSWVRPWAWARLESDDCARHRETGWLQELTGWATVTVCGCGRRGRGRVVDPGGGGVGVCAGNRLAVCHRQLTVLRGLQTRSGAAGGRQLRR